MYYSRELKDKVVKEFLKGDVNKAFPQRKYNILGHSTISSWVANYHKDKFRSKTFKALVNNEKLETINNINNTLNNNFNIEM